MKRSAELLLLVLPMLASAALMDGVAAFLRDVDSRRFPRKAKP